VKVSGEKKNKEEVNEVALRLHASDVKEMEASATEGRPLDTRVKEAHKELGERNTDRQVSKV
jgi:hypothetical protein